MVITDYNRYRGGRKPTVYTKITAESLSLLYGVSIRTIKRWISNKILDPTDIKDIIRIYNKRLWSKGRDNEKV